MSTNNIGIRTITASDVRDSSTTQQDRLGAIAQTADGRIFRYVKAGGALASGKLAVSAAAVANHTNVAVVGTAAIGATQVTITLGATAAAENDYAEGFLYINAGTGAGQTLVVKSHAANAGSSSLIVTLEDPLQVALTSVDSKASLIKNPFKDVTHSTTLGKAAGVGVAAIASGSFGWLMTRGLAAVLATGAITKGLPVRQDATTTAGAVQVDSAATDQTVGVAQEAGVTTEYRTVFVQID